VDHVVHAVARGQPLVRRLLGGLCLNRREQQL